MSTDAYLLSGAALSLLMTELFGVSPGGIIVPGWLALSSGSPLRLGLSFLDALIAWLIVKALARRYILFGRRRFALFLIAGFLSRILTEAVMGGLLPGLGLVEAVGWLIPGIMASEMERQGPLLTLIAAIAALLALLLLGSAFA